MNWDRLDAIDMLSAEDRRVLVEHLAAELVKPGGMDKIEPPKQLDEAFVPVRNAPPPWVRRTTKHGSLSGYTAGCRCNPCRDANSEYKRKYTAKQAAKKAQTPPVSKPEPLPRVAPFTVLHLDRPPVMPFERTSVSHEKARARAAEACE